MKTRQTWYSGFSTTASRMSGRPATFGIAVLFILAWMVSGPFFGFSETWQLVINTGTTIVTFLMVFLIQSAQNRDTEAIQLKLDELIRATYGAHNTLLNLEEMDPDELEQFRARYRKLAEKALHDLKAGRGDIDSPEA